MLTKLALWFIKRKLAKSSTLILERDVENILSNMILHNFEQTYKEDNPYEHVYLLSFYIAKAIRYRYIGVDYTALEKGIQHEFHTVFTDLNYHFTNDKSS